jgi:hypothetical protein
MVDPKMAVQKAIEYLNEFYDTSQYRDILLEEVERSEDNSWLITIGYSIPVSEPPSMADQLLKNLSPGANVKYRRQYKIFKVDGISGEMHSMKMRQV